MALSMSAGDVVPVCLSWAISATCSCLAGARRVLADLQWHPQRQLEAGIVHGVAVLPFCPLPTGKWTCRRRPASFAGNDEESGS